MAKNYYRILEVDKSAGEDEIKRAYRRLALKYHPDRNPGDRRSEDRFKEIAEAYAVLINTSKRDDYDQLRSGRPGGYTRSGPGFHYGPDDFFREMFRNPGTADFFSELEKEFQMRGFRFNETFFNDLFSRRQNVFFGGIYCSNASGNRFYTFGNRTSQKSEQFTRRAEDLTAPEPSAGLLEMISGAFRKGLNEIASLIGLFAKVDSDRDLTYRIRISRREALSGKELRVSLNRGRETERLSIRIPSGVQDGARLKLAGMGRSGDGGNPAGDLYIKVKII